MKFGFVYRTPTPERGIFYNGDKSNLRYCYDPVEAEEWYNKHKDDFIEIKLQRPGALTVNVHFPFKEHGERGTRELENRAGKTKRIDARILAYIDTFSKQYIITEEGYFVRNNVTDISSDDNMASLQMMKDVLLGVVRLTPIKIFTGLDKHTKAKVYADLDISSDYEIEYAVNGKKHKTKIFGVYASALRNAVGEESIVFDGGYNMQAWQRHYNFYRAQITAVHACRGSGKTMCETPDSIIYAFKEETYDYEKINGIVQHFFSLSMAAVKSGPLKYIRNAMGKLFKGTEKKAWKYDRHDSKFYLFDGEDYSDGGTKERAIMLLSVGSEDKGIGQRPCKSKLDESAWYPTENGTRALEIALGTNYNEVTLLTTINHKEGRNREYDFYMTCKARMVNNEDLPTLIHRLWTKYGFDKCESREDYHRMIQDGTFKRVREEFHSRYKYVALKYTIDEVDEIVIAKDKKEEMVTSARDRSEQLMLAEYYSEYIDSYPEFISSGLVDATTPNKFEEVIIGFDEGGGYDNPAIVVGGISQNKLYIKYSERLPKEPKEKRDGVRKIMDLAKRWSTNGRVKFVCSATGGNAFSAHKDALEATGQVDMLIKETKAGEDSAKEFYAVTAGNGLPYHHRVGKKYLVKVARDYFFNKGNIILDASLETEKGLLEELENYKAIGGTYKAAKGKDDQVAAMLFVCVYAYEMVLKDSYRKEDLMGEGQYEQFISNWKGIKSDAEKKFFENDIHSYINHRL